MPVASVPVLTFVAAAAMLAAAVWHDVRYRRVPNAVVLGGTLAGLALAGAAIANSAHSGARVMIASLLENNGFSLRMAQRPCASNAVQSR